MSGDQETLHANCVLINDTGILVRGASGSGKSSMSRALIEGALARNWFARLVADDRTRIACRHGRLIARPVDIIRGMIEIRGVGIVEMPVQDAAVLRLVIDLEEHAPRMPGDADQQAEILGLTLPRIVRNRGEDIVGHVLASLCGAARPVAMLHEKFKGFS